jgi:two-component system cell cycle sensor histidine kinase/response regulator CckA
MTRRKTKGKGKDISFNNHSIYSSIIKEIRIPGCFLDPEGTFLLSNTACNDLFGVKKGGLVGRNLKEFVNPKVFKRVREWKNKKNNLSEFEISKSDGKNKTLHGIFSPKYISDKKKKKYIGSLVLLEDITAGKKFGFKLKEQIDKIEKELVFKNNLLSSLLHKTPDRIYFKDKKSRFVQVSRALVEKLGVENMGKVIGKTDFDFFTKPHAQQAYREEQKMIKTKKPVIGKVIEETYLDGRTAWVSTTKVPWYDEKGEVIGILGISRDITETKELEDKLKKRLAELGEEVIFKSNLLTSLLENIPDLIYFKDKNSKFVRVNKAKALKADKEEEFLIGKTDFDFFPKDEAEEMLKDEKQIIERGKSIIEKEQKVTRPDGREEWVLVTKVPRYDEEGNIIGTLGISRDVTQRKKAQEQLKENEERTRAILSALPDILFQVKKDGTFISYYTGNEDTLYAKPDEFLNKNIQDILPKDLAVCSKSSIKEAIKTGKVVSFEYQLTAKDDLRDWEARFSKIDKETALILIRDITEKKNAQREKSKLDDLIEQSSDAILRLDTEMHIDYTNKATKELFDYPFAELKGKTLEFLIADPDFKEIQRDIFEKVTNGEIYSGEHLNIKKDGSAFFCHMRVMPLFDDSNNIYGYMASLRDISEERKSREELVFRKNLLDSLLELTPDEIFFKDRDCRYLEVSASKAKKFGVPKEEIIGKTDFSFFDEEVADEYFEEEQEIIKSRKPMPGGVGKRIDKNGEVHWVSYTKVPRHDKEGNVIGIIGISRDITKLKKAEEDLRREEELLSNALESMEDGILVLDRNFHFTYWNSSMERISGIPREKVLKSKKLPWEIFPNLKEAEIDDMMKKAMEGEVVKRDKIPYKSKDAIKTFTSEMYLPLKNPEGDIYGIVGVVKEITKEIESEETLKESEEKYRILVENSREGICIFRNDRFLFVNDYLCDILRCSKEELYKVEVWDIISEDDRNIVREMERRRGVGEEIPDVYEANIITQKGDVRFCEFSIIKITYQGLESFMGIIRDITEYKDMEKEREKADRLESLGILAGGIAHDFNNFLTGILGNISLAKLHLDSNEEVYDILEESERAAQSARSLTQQLLTFSKGGSPVKVNIDVEDLVRSSANFVLSGSNVRCNFEFSEDLWNVKADRGQLTQVFNNLILNADQAMPEGGIITIRGENFKQDQDKSLPLKMEKYVKVEIHDRGIGIPEDVLPKIFDPFFTTKQKGSGLGLSTVFSIIKRHEGHITVQSKLGKGTSFFVYLPATDKDKSRPNEKEKKIPKGRGKILIMDDKSFVRNAAVKALILFGYEVEGVADGAEAVLLYRKEMNKGKPFGLIILDLTIPGGMGGEDTLKKLREINPEVKAIVSSGYSEDPVMSEFKKHGFNAIVRKPYQYEELCEIVRKVIEEK